MIKTGHERTRSTTPGRAACWPSSSSSSSSCNWRPTLIIGLAIPLSIITTFIALYAAGYTLNLLTLGGLALGVGMLVDNAIVVIENIFRHLEEGEDAKTRPPSLGASEVGMAITASTLTTIVVFLPMIFASGITGKLTRGLALSIAFSLLSSLFVALTIVPLSTSLLFRSEKQPRGRIAEEPPRSAQFAKAKAFYPEVARQGPPPPPLGPRRRDPGLRRCPWPSSPSWARNSCPPMDQDMIILKVRMPVGTSLEETDRVVGMVENIMAGQPEINIDLGPGRLPGRGRTPATPPRSSANAGTHEGLLCIGLVKRDKRKESDNAGPGADPARSCPSSSGVKFEALDMSQ